jgi:hypothetical protein
MSKYGSNGKVSVKGLVGLVFGESEGAQFDQRMFDC